MYVYRLCSVLVCVFSLAGCSSLPVGNLNEPLSAQSISDSSPMPGYKPRKLPYEFETNGGITVGYNLRLGFVEDTQVYWLRLILRNEDSEVTTLSPSVSMTDSTGLAIPPYSFEGYLGYLAAIGTDSMSAGSIPVAPASSPSSYYHTGTITTSAGTTYKYSGTSRSQSNPSAVGAFAEGMAKGMAQAQASNAQQRIREQRQARELMVWADANWLRSNYTIRSREAATGVLIFPAGRDLPLSVSVTISGKTFSFDTSNEVHNN